MSADYTNAASQLSKRVRITARDEHEAHYPMEGGLGNAPDPGSGQLLVARAFNLSATPAGIEADSLTLEV